MNVWNNERNEPVSNKNEFDYTTSITTSNRKNMISVPSWYEQGCQPKKLGVQTESLANEST